jgi:hypothetical protein
MPSTNILLVGAGFTRNWGAPLANEVAASLIAAVGRDSALQQLLRRHDRNFDNALSEVQRDFLSSPSSAGAKQRFDALQGAIAAVFDRLNQTFERRTDFNFTNDLTYSVLGFLARFDAIFSLNQDLLLELRYAEHVLTASNVRWNGLELPGMRPVHDPSLTGIGDKHRRQWTPAAQPFSVTDRFQPLFKIHGSSNWYTADGRKLLVMGGNKEFMIREHEVLRWYYEEFKRRLMTGHTKLMVVGYSFSDQHINDAIVDAWQKGNLSGMFLVDPAGRSILNPTPVHHIKVPKGIEEVPSLGGSTRLLSETFAGDAFEHHKLLDFFRD